MASVLLMEEEGPVRRAWGSGNGDGSSPPPLFRRGAARHEEIAMAGKKILIVDDSATERYFFMETLSKQGYECITAQNGDEAIQKSRSEMPDVILMDIVMPGIDGYKATRTISHDEATKHIPVIICTSRNQETDRVWGMRQGAKDFLVKPVSAKDLIKKVAATTAG